MVQSLKNSALSASSDSVSIQTHDDENRKRFKIRREKVGRSGGLAALFGMDRGEFSLQAISKRGHLNRSRGHRVLRCGDEVFGRGVDQYILAHNRGRLHGGRFWPHLWNRLSIYLGSPGGLRCDDAAKQPQGGDLKNV